MSGSDGDGGVAGVHDLVVVNIDVRRFVGAIVTIGDNAAAAVVLRVGVDGIEPLDVIVVDLDRAGGGAAGIVDVHHVVDVALARLVDDLIPGDFDVGDALDVAENDGVRRGIAGVFVSAVAVAIPAVGVFDLVVKYFDGLRSRAVEAVDIDAVSADVVDVVVFDIDAGGIESVQKIALGNAGDVGIQAVARIVFDGKLAPATVLWISRPAPRMMESSMVTGCVVATVTAVLLAAVSSQLPT